LIESISRHPVVRHSREEWIDVVKLFACVLVALGHLFQSFSKTGIIAPQSWGYNYFDSTIYRFHVPVFFFCSGYLYQKYVAITSWKDYRNNINKKAINLSIPYFTFSIITLSLKSIFRSTTATPITAGFWETLFLQPTSPYWFLYVLFFLFLMIPTIQFSSASYSLIFLFLLLKILVITSFKTKVYAIDGVMNNGIWFILGMYASYVRLIPRISSWNFLTYLFFPASLYVFAYHVKCIAIDLLLTFGGISMSVLSIHHFCTRNKIPKSISYASRYSMHIFLLHTICAAPIRSVLFKFGYHGFPIHLLAGLIFSFLLPILIGMLSQKFQFINFFFSPFAALRLSFSKQTQK